MQDFVHQPYGSSFKLEVAADVDIITTADGQNPALP